MAIELRPVDRDNWETVACLQVEAPQREFVASNAFSLAQAAYVPLSYPLAICRDGEPVGFILYDFDPELGNWEMCRLMVDRRFQKQGIGRAAVTLLCDLVREHVGHIPFATSTDPNNAVGLALYESLGFVRDGRIEEDEVVLVKQL